MENSGESVMQMFIMSLGGFNKVYKMMKYCQPVLNYIGKLEFVVFIGLVTVLLVNLLIAMMGNTYSEIAAIKNEWMRQVGFVIFRGYPTANVIFIYFLRLCHS